MIQSPLQELRSPRLHVAIIMDGSGRWAQDRGLLRMRGHEAGVEAVRRTIAAAPGLGVRALTLHSFSRDNWQRPQDEVAALLRIFEDFLLQEPPQWAVEGVRLTVIGGRDRMPPSLRDTIELAESITACGRTLDLRLAIDYSAREAICAAAERGRTSERISEEAFGGLLADASGSREPIPQVDLLVRTGGEQRLSDFFLWECAYAELYFTSRLWPDFSAEDLTVAITEFHSRDRRFGRIAHPAAV